MSYVPKVGIDYAYETDCPAWKCPHISVHDWREGRRCSEHPCTCPEPAVPEHAAIEQ